MNSETINFSSEINGKIVHATYSRCDDDEGAHELYIKKIRDLNTGSLYEEKGNSSGGNDWNVWFSSDGVQRERSVPYRSINLNHIFREFNVNEKFRITTGLKNYEVKKSLVKSE